MLLNHVSDAVVLFCCIEEEVFTSRATALLRLISFGLISHKTWGKLTLAEKHMKTKKGQKK